MDKFNFADLLVEKDGRKVRFITRQEFKNLPREVREFQATDYATFMNCKRIDNSRATIVRPMDSLRAFGSINGVITSFGMKVYETNLGIVPVVELAIPKVTPNFKAKPKLVAEFNKLISEMIVEHQEYLDLRFIEMGEFPQTIVNTYKEDELEKLYLDGKLTPTGRLFSSTISPNMGRAFDGEFEYEGQKYVRLIARAYPDEKVSRNNGNNGNTVRITAGKAYWAKVEPIRFYIANYDSLPKSVNPNGSGSAKSIVLVSQKALTSSIQEVHEEPYIITEEGFDSLEEVDGEASMEQTARVLKVINGFSEALCYLNGEIAYKASPEARYDTTGGFLGEALDLTKTFDKTLRFDEKDTLCYGYDVDGLDYYDRIVLSDTTTVASDVWEKRGFKYAYAKRGSGEVYLCREIPNDVPKETPVVDLVDAGKCFISTEGPYEIASVPNIDKLLKVLKKTKCAFPFDYFADAFDDDLENMIKNDNFHFAYEVAKVMGKRFNYPEVMQFMQSIGCFSNKKIIDKNGKETDVIMAQKACSFMCRIYKTDKYLFDFLFENRYKYTKDVNQDFLAFIMVKNSKGEYENFNLLKSVCEFNNTSYTRISNGFEDVKKLRKGIDERGMPFTRSWKDALILFCAKKSYIGYDEEDEDMAKVFISHGVSQNCFAEATELRREAEENDIRRHILSVPLREKTILEQIEELKNKTADELKDASKSLDKVYEKAFTYEMLDKRDPINFIIGLYVDCCCTITSSYYGGDIARGSVSHNDVQNMILRDSRGDVVGKATIYVSDATRNAVFNEFDLSEKYQDNPKYRQKALVAFLRGTKAFIEQYDKEHPDAPLRKVHVGIGYNKLIDELKGFEHVDNYWEEENVRVPDELSFRDAEEAQIVLYRRSKSGTQGIDMFNDESDADETKDTEIIDF